MDVTICVATYGDREWADLANRRAIPSAKNQPGVVVHYHGATLHEARSELLAVVTTPWVCFLDADDELEPGYIGHTAAGTADIRVPSVRYVTADNHPRSSYTPRVAGHRHDCTGECLPEGNWIVIGAVVRTDIAQRVGWREWACYEDWDLWLRCWQAGATIGRTPEAVYRAHVRSGSRNRAGSPAERLETHRQIAMANGVPVP